MKSLIQFSLKNKFAVWLLTIIIVFAGLYSGLTMKQETLPNISIPYLSVTTIYPGAAPEAVVNDVSKPLEQKLRNVDGVKTITSSSLENASSIQIEFDYGTNLDNATAAVREALNEVTLPADARKPQISRFSLSSLPVISLSLAGNGPADLEELTRIAENDIRPALEDIEGVASVSIAGQYVKEVSLKFDQAKLKQYGLTEDTIKGIVQASSLRVPLGLFEMDESQKAVVVDGNISTVEDLENLAVPLVPSAASGSAGAGAGAGGAGVTGAAGTGAGAGAAGAAGAGVANAGAAAAAGLPTVKLGELASIEVTGKSESISRTNGKESIGIQIVKANDANTVEVVNSVKDKTEELKQQYGSLDLTVLLDQGKPIEDSVHTMLSKAVFGALFAVLIILLFLRNIRSTIISIISIPLSLLIAVLCLRQMDITLNMMTLGAMTVAIGRVVDDSIVVIENIYRRMSLSGEKLRGRELISAATREMFVPIMSSTIVTIAVFLPLAFVSGMVGELFLPFALTMVFSLIASLIVAITLVPALAHSLFRGGLKQGKKVHEEKPGRMAAGYQKILDWCLSHKLITFGAAVLLLAGSLFLIKPIGVSFMPSQEDKSVIMTFSPKAGQTAEDVQEQGLKAEKFILAQEHVTNLQYSIGGSGFMGMGSNNSGLFYITYDSDTPDFETVKEELIENLTAEVPDGAWGDMSGMAGGGLGGNTLTVNIFGDTLEQLKPVADEIAGIVNADTKNFKDGDTSLSESYEQYTIVADQAKLSSLGLTAGQLAMKLSPVNTRPVLTEVAVDGKNYNVYIEADTTTYSSIQEMEDAQLTSPLGFTVPVSQVATIEKGTSPDSITRIDGKMSVEVTADIIATDVNSASNSVKEQIEALDLPDGVTVSFGGVTEQINETFGQLGIAMAAAVAIVYFVLVVTFGGGLAPFAILFSLPFTVIGALVALLLAGETLNVSALMGALMLIGIVVTNAIVLIDRVIHKENEGMTTRQALLEAGGTRLRPILMTALATIGALLPLVTGLENSAGIISKGLGVTVIGGLVSSTLLTLVVVPVVYEFLMKFRKKRIEE
ncbi:MULTISPECIES: efflux RND transporter permease subunit [unclassified Paenibacillus]|uniref:efflux RND transporter permease subunit n=1 Tax=unclassified Paenibacillus TaxID=185978 RepID=UPI00240665A1|nr:MULTISPECIES: efflux RND transporter permease subunit [unclassified Paenibacillus]MDF9840068.1 multidrug efflux pump subunit AcrB [Paenibacillus sp. PastF-2]MDF9846650.1 multidrug efflux pump subunit AcrB [Paenibacillus sp. PastM-2]MDF9853002.1 multidrug efflux pump subunit AcrB [Paenibacillus sp. PastF-1]MDH6478494.1 multidrug efflux pump subunit AcrB [Paenibacillus sp. PastH-2]MDH6506008.1 multidrug efflux pump subunit AcrB [Paenibacillus sp. PastM-3]